MIDLLHLDFYGVRCALGLPTNADREHFAYYFSDFVDERPPLTRPDLELELGVLDSACSFIEALQRPDVEKRIRLRRDGAWELYEQFRGTSTRPSPVPPFHLPPLADRLQLFHAACVQAPSSGRLVALAGPSLSGKSTLTLALAHRGFRVLTDDILVFDRHQRRVLPFCRPIGIRAHTRALLPWLESLPGLSAGVRFDTDVGSTIMVRLSDLFPGRAGQADTLAAVYLLRPGDHTVRRLDGPPGFEALCAHAYVDGREITVDVRRELTTNVAYFEAYYRLQRDAEHLADAIAETWS